MSLKDVRKRFPVLAAARRLNDFPELAVNLRNYILLVGIVGPLLSFALFLSGFNLMDQDTWVLAAVLAILATAAERHPLHLTHKTNVNVGTAVYLAMFVLLPWQVPAALVVVAAIVAQYLRLRANPNLQIAEPFFNVGQTSLYVATGALAIGGMQHFPGLSDQTRNSELGILLVASVTMHLVNTALVATAAGLQMGISVPRVWWQNLSLDLTPHVTLTVVGGMAAKLAQISPYLLPTFVIPGFLIHRAVSQTVRLRVDTHEALASLVEVIEMRDPYTAGHSRRVAATSRLLAHQLGLTEEEADIVESAGTVHDIGKIALDPMILIKTSKLDAAEWEQMRQHPVHGANVIDRFAAYQRGAAFVRHHHESWNGSGYPDGLSGIGIPLGSRIIAVADTFDALTSDRPYRTGMSVARASEILREGAGIQWDPQVVAAMLRLLESSPGEVPLFRERPGSIASAVAA